MDGSTKDWLVVGCSMASLCASLAVPVVTNFIGSARQRLEGARSLRHEAYAAAVSMAARANERFLSASIRRNLMRARPEQPELSAHVDEDVGAGWVALEELGRKLQSDQLVFSDKIIALVSDYNRKHFWNAESLFRMYGHAAIDIDDLQKHSQEFLTKLKQRCRREIGLGS